MKLRKYGWNLDQKLGSCLRAWSHWLTINTFLGNTYHYMVNLLLLIMIFQNDAFKMTIGFPRRQWVDDWSLVSSQYIIYQIKHHKAFGGLGNGEYEIIIIALKILYMVCSLLVDKGPSFINYMNCDTAAHSINRYYCLKFCYVYCTYTCFFSCG